MTVLVIDSSVLIDLVHAGIDRDALTAWAMEAPELMVLTELPEYESRLKRHGLLITSLTDVEEELAADLYAQHGHAKSPSKRQAKKVVSRNDCSVLAIAKCRVRVMLVADQALRDLATQHQVEAHGLLWLLDRMDQERVLERPLLVAALEKLALRPRRRLPEADVQRLLRAWR